MTEPREAGLAALGFNLLRQRAARAYGRRRVALSALRTVLYIAVAVVLLQGFTFQVKGWAGTFGSGPAQWALYAVLLYLLFWLPTIPLSLYGSAVERRFGISVQSLRSRLADAGKGLALGLVFSVITVEVLYALLSAQPDLWWAFAWAIAMAVAVLLAWIAPVALAPLFYRFEPLRDEELAARLDALAQRSGTKVVGAYRMLAGAKTTRAFGGLAGVRNTRRIILSDTLLSRYSADEVEVVVAHELGHHVGRDIPRLLALGAVVSLPSLYFVHLALRAAVPELGLEGIADIAGLPLIAVSIAATSTMVSPFLNAVSRWREAKADAFALRMTGNRDAFRSAMVKVHDQNLGVADPNRLVELLTHDHPAGARRVRAALHWRS